MEERRHNRSMADPNLHLSLSPHLSLPLPAIPKVIPNPGTAYSGFAGFPGAHLRPGYLHISLTYLRDWAELPG